MLKERTLPRSIREFRLAFLDADRAPFAILLISVFLNAGGQLMFKAARLAHPDASLFGILLHYEMWLALAVYGLSAASWLWVLSRLPLSLAYPVLALSFPLVVGISVLFYAEPVTALHWAGVGVIFAGVCFLARS